MESYIKLRTGIYPARVIKNGHIATIEFENSIPMEMEMKGFEYYAYPGAIANNYMAFNTVYRYENGIYQMSDDGSVYVEPRHTVIISAVFDDGGEAERPSMVVVDVDFSDGTKESYSLSSDNGYTTEIYDIRDSVSIEVSAPDIEGWVKTIEGGTVTYYFPHEVIIPPSVEERLSTLELSMDEVYVSVTDLMYDVTILQFGIDDVELMMEGDM